MSEMFTLEASGNMQLTQDQIDVVLRTAQSLIGRPYADDFRCVDFVRNAFSAAGIIIPKLTAQSPPAKFNIKKEELDDPPIGHIMFLKDRTDPRKERAWTHVVIVLPKKTCIHCSLFYGERVAVSSFEELFAIYDFAESTSSPE